MLLRCNHIMRIKRKSPTFRCSTERILEVWQQPPTYALGERLTGWKGSTPSQNEGSVGSIYDTDVLNNEGLDALGIPRSELVGVNTPERITQENGLVDFEVIKQRTQVSEIVLSSITLCMVGISMSTLIQCDDPPRGCQCCRKVAIGDSLHPKSVEGN